MTQVLREITRAQASWGELGFKPLPPRGEHDEETVTLRSPERVNGVTLPRSNFQPAVYDLSDQYETLGSVADRIKNTWSGNCLASIALEVHLGECGGRVGSHILSELVFISSVIHRANTAVMAGDVDSDTSKETTFAYWDDGTTYKDTSVMRAALVNQDGGLADTQGTVRPAILGEAILRNAIIGIGGIVLFASGEHRLMINRNDSEGTTRDNEFHYSFGSGTPIEGNALIFTFPHQRAE